MKPLIMATLLLTILFVATVLPAATLPVNLGVPFVLGPGQSAGLVDGELYLVFTGVLSDSRCPLAAICVWEGDAEVAVVGDLPGEIQIHGVLHTSAMFSRSCSMGIYKVWLLGVEPYPVLGGPPIDPADYLATLLIVEAGPVDIQEKAWGAIKALYR